MRCQKYSHARPLRSGFRISSHPRMDDAFGILLPTRSPAPLTSLADNFFVMNPCAGAAPSWTIADFHQAMTQKRSRVISPLMTSPEAYSIN